MPRKLILAMTIALLPSLCLGETLERLLVERGLISRSEADGLSYEWPARIYWNDGLRLEFPDHEGFTFRLNTFVQTRYSFLDNEDAPNTSSFDITRARLTASGSLFYGDFSYFLNAEMSGLKDAAGESDPELLDAFLAWRPADWALVKMGQFKTPYSRQFNSLDFKLQFAERSLVSDFFTLGRQSGSYARADLLDGRMRLGGGLFNGSSAGEGRNKPGVDVNHTFTADLRWNPIGSMDPAEEGDIEMSEDPALSFGTVYAYSDADLRLAEDGLETSNRHSVSVDANFKLLGFSLHGELFESSLDPEQSRSSDAVGFYSQVGYFLMPRRVEIAGRYGYLDCDDGSAGGRCNGLAHTNEVTAGVNYYWWNHNLKAQLNYVLKSDDPALQGDGDVDNSAWLLQLTGFL